MGSLLISTDNGVFLLEREGDGPVREEAPALAFVTRGHQGVLGIEPGGALWERSGNSHWRTVKKRPVEEQVWSLSADPRIPGRLYIGTQPALLYRSDDGGESWTACESVRRIPGYERWTFPPPPHVAHVRSIAADPQVEGAVYIGVEEGGVYRSPDGGETWESLNKGLYWDVHTVIPSAEARRLYATTGTGFFRTDDGGGRWKPLMEGLDRSYTVPLVVSPGQQERLYTAAAATPPPGWRHAGANAAIYATVDGGDHWARLQGGLPTRFDKMVRALAVDEQETVYAAAGGHLLASRDEGASWTSLANDLPTIRALLPL